MVCDEGGGRTHRSGYVGAEVNLRLLPVHPNVFFGENLIKGPSYTSAV